MSALIETATMIAFGAAEGYGMAMTGIPSPQFFRDQMTFANFGIMKFFLTAVGSSMVAQSFMSMFYPKQFEISRFYTYLKVPYSRSIPGCFVLGLGMYIAASGPTMMGTQLWMGVASTPYVILGALAGGAMFGMLEPSLGLAPMQPVKKASDTSVDGKLGVSYATVALPMGLALLGATHMFEVYFPHSIDIAKNNMPYCSMLPILGASLIGLNQIPVRFITQDGQGGSTCIMNTVSTVTNGLISAKHKMTKLSDAHQLVYVYVGMGVGTWLAMQAMPGFVAPKDFGNTSGFIGGVLAAFGARWAGGCTCGHGVSGVSELSLSSWAGAAFIFIGGIAAGTVHTTLL